MVIKLSNLKIAREDKSDIWCYCPFHNDKKTPNLLISKTGKFAGHFKCFACGAFGKVDMEGKRKNVMPKSKPNSINWAALNKLYESNYRIGVAPFDKWDVSKNTLHLMRIGWDGESHTFPVCNAKKEMIGIQRIYPDNSKKMVNGSRVGIIIPLYTNFKQSLIITEGISDTAMAVELSWNVIGRLSCSCGEDIIVEIVKNHRTPKIIIIGDNDIAGIKGMNKLRESLATRLNHKGVYGIIPEKGSDLREWVNLSEKNQIKQYIKNITLSMPVRRTKK